MASELQNSAEPSMASLVAGIIRDAQVLITQEMALARREIADEINKTKQALVSLSLGVGVAALGGLLLVLMLVHLLHEEWHLQLWQSYGLIGLLLAVIGGTLFFVGRSRASTIRLVPPQTVQAMKENVQWIKNRT
jgi:hypothetical protein